MEPDADAVIFETISAASMADSTQQPARFPLGRGHRPGGRSGGTAAVMTDE
jgi:hypothetical protein